MTIKVSGLNGVINRLKPMAKNEEMIFDKGNLRLMKRLRRMARYYSPRDSKRLWKSIQYKKTRGKGKSNQYMLVVGEGLERGYAIAVNDGRKPGRAPPVQDLMKWGKLDPGKMGESSRYAAALKLSKFIAKRGTRQTRYIERTLNYMYRILPEEIDRSISELMKK